MDPKEYKAFHESFMQNNNGTSVVETFLTIVPSFFTTFFSVLITTSFAIGVPGQLLLEFFIIVLPLIFVLTVGNEYIVEINVACLVVTLSIMFVQLRGKLHLEPFIQIPIKRPQFLTLCRSVVNIITIVCILAVDFQVFPRNLAKTETFGFGLMDTGVGLYVLINGVTSTEARAEEFDRMTWKRFQKTLLGVLPLVAIGLGRFLLTNELDYQQHVSEYGVHWNFFITLAAVRLFGSLAIGILPSPKYAHYLSIGIVCMHEMTLQLGLSSYVMTSDRDNFINANREGIVSIPGYIALYLISLWAGHLIKFNEEFIRPKRIIRTFLVLFFATCFCWKMIFVCDSMFGTSRRLANMSYCFWNASIAASMLVLFMAMEVVVHFILFDQKETKDKSSEPKRNYVPIIYEAINYNGLIFFILGNVLTGLVNLVFQPLLLSSVASLFIIGYYAFTIVLIMTFLYVNKIKLKFW